MSWYKQSWSGKTYRDDRSTKILYHVSPNRLTRLSPRSSFMGVSGSYVTDSYKSIIQDWSYYVMNKKHKHHPLGLRWEELWEESRALPEDDPRQEEINIQIEKLRDSMENDAYKKSIEGYKTLYVHKLECPSKIYKEAVDFFNKKYEENATMDNFGFWGWGPQVFIPAQFLDELKILSVEEMNMGEMINKDRGFDANYRRRMGR